MKWSRNEFNFIYHNGDKRCMKRKHVLSLKETLQQHYSRRENKVLTSGKFLMFGKNTNDCHIWDCFGTGDLY